MEIYKWIMIDSMLRCEYQRLANISLVVAMDSARLLYTTILKRLIFQMLDNYQEPVFKYRTIFPIGSTTHWFVWFVFKEPIEINRVRFAFSLFVNVLKKRKHFLALESWWNRKCLASFSNLKYLNDNLDVTKLLKIFNCYSIVLNDKDISLLSFSFFLFYFDISIYFLSFIFFLLTD